jgi:hypothetical protein
MKPHHVILEGFSVNFKSGLLVSSSRRIENKHSFGEQVGVCCQGESRRPTKEPPRHHGFAKGTVGDTIAVNVKRQLCSSKRISAIDKG